MSEKKEKKKFKLFGGKKKDGTESESASRSQSFMESSSKSPSRSPSFLKGLAPSSSSASASLPPPGSFTGFHPRGPLQRMKKQELAKTFAWHAKDAAAMEDVETEPFYLTPYTYYITDITPKQRAFLLFFAAFSVVGVLFVYLYFHDGHLPPCFWDYPPRNCISKPGNAGWAYILFIIINIALFVLFVFPQKFGFKIPEKTDPEILTSLRLFYPPSARPLENRYFPAYGFWAMCVMLLAWILSFSRYGEWMGTGYWNIKLWVFPPLWFGFIFFLDAWVFYLRGESLYTCHKKHFAHFFLTSTLSWWLYEFLGIFQQVWWYPNGDVFPRWWIAILATICYATIQPAIFEWYDLLCSFWWFQNAYSQGPKLPIGLIKPMGWFIVALVAYVIYAVDPEHFLGAATALGAPMVGFAASVTVVGVRTPWTLIKNGNYAPLFTMMLACLANAFFWEMWNEGTLNSAPLPQNSSALWKYELMYINNYFFFEVPALAFISYLPFGITNLTQYIYFSVLFNLDGGKKGLFWLIVVNIAALVIAIIGGMFK